jgi:Xylose isomerase-like TIM barrel
MDEAKLIIRTTQSGSLTPCMGERLLIYQALWAMDRLQDPEASMGQKFDRVRDAGFDGIAIDLGALSEVQAEESITHFARTGLKAGLTAFPDSIATLRSACRLARRISAPFLVVIGQHMPIELEKMVAVVESWLKVAAEEGIPIHFETHRNCITNDLFTTVQLLDAIPQMRLAADLSHYVVDREMPCPPTPALQELIIRILERCDSFQGRVAARGQIQLPLHFPQNQKWVRMFRHWWHDGFASWRVRHRDSAEPMIFTCELGPPDYALTDARGKELSDRWAESLLMREWARECWGAVCAADAAISHSA